MSNACCDAGTVPSMLSLEAALARIVADAVPPEPITVPLDAADGFVLAADLTAGINVPPFDNSAMDGFAFDSAALLAATPARPVRLTVDGASIAGQCGLPPRVKPGCAIKIMTGAPLPEGADAVLPVEAAGWDHRHLVFTAPYPAGKHVRRAGQDIRAADTILARGTRIEVRHLPLLCAAGAGRLAVVPPPATVWISTGQELVEDFSHPLPEGGIYNATRLYARVAAGQFGLHITRSLTVGDTRRDFARSLETALHGDPRLIITTGGVSAGQFDFVRPVLEEMGAEIIVHRVRIKPGKPLLFARLPNGTRLFGLPGNPVSTLLGLRIFVYPYLRAMNALGPEHPVRARLLETCHGNPEKTVFLMASIGASLSGELVVRPHARQQSFQTLPYAQSNCWLKIPVERSRIEAGEPVSVIPFSPDFPVN
jgi:molybdopterin molybdotransferase